MSTPPFTFTAEGIRLCMSVAEANMLRNLGSDLSELLAELPAADPVVGRLFPTTTLGDDEADEELRRLIHDDLLTERIERLDEVTALLDRGTIADDEVEVTLVDDEPVLVLMTINDIRLAIGSRIGVDRLERRDRLPSKAHAMVQIMDHLAYWQEHLIDAMDPIATSHYEDHEDQL